MNQKKNRKTVGVRLNPKNVSYIDFQFVPSSSYENRSDFLDALISEIKVKYPDGIAPGEEFVVKLPASLTNA